MNELLGLLLDRSNDVGMAMACRADGNAGIEVEKSIAVDILHNRAAGALRNQRVWTRVGGRDVPAVALDNPAGFGSRQFCDEPWKFFLDYF